MTVSQETIPLSHTPEAAATAVSGGLISPMEIIRIAWEGVARNKARSLLTMLGVIIGVAAVIIMIAISAGTERAIADQIQGLGSNLVFIQSGLGRGGPGSGSGSSAPQLLYQDIAVVQSVYGVTGTAVEQNTAQTVRAGSVILDDVSLVGATPDFPAVRDVRLANGRFFNETELDRKARVAVLGSSLAVALFGERNPVGETVTIGTTRLTIIGVAAPKGMVGAIDFDAQLYLPVTLVFDKFMPNQFRQFAGDRVRLIYAQIDPEADIEMVTQQIQLKLAAAKNLTLEEFPFTVQTQTDIIAAQSATTEAFRNLLAWVAGVSLVVGGIGIMNIMLVSVTERTREIGIRQSVGATPNDVRLQFLTEALILSLGGGLIGIVAGIGGAYLFGATSEMRTVVVPGSIALAFGSAAAVGIFFGLFPANKAAQLDPIEALRHE
jgi:putative ABC transport system permease protein